MYHAIQSVILIFSRSLLHTGKLRAPSFPDLDSVQVGGSKGQVTRVTFSQTHVRVIQEWFKLCHLTARVT